MQYLHGSMPSPSSRKQSKFLPRTDSLGTGERFSRYVHFVCLGCVLYCLVHKDQDGSGQLSIRGWGWTIKHWGGGGGGGRFGQYKNSSPTVKQGRKPFFKVSTPLPLRSRMVRPLSTSFKHRVSLYLKVEGLNLRKR